MAFGREARPSSPGARATDPISTGREPRGLVQVVPPELKTIRDDAGFVALEDDWEELRQRSALKSPFASFMWLYAWWAELGQRRDTELRLLAVRQDGRLVGLGPFYIERGGAGARCLRNLGDRRLFGRCLGPLLDREREAWAARLMARMIHDARDIDAVELTELDPKAAFAQEVQRGLRMGFGRVRTLTEPACVCASAAEAQGLESAWAMKARAFVEGHPQASVSRVREEAELPDALERLFRLHGRQGTALLQRSPFKNRELRAFLRRATPKLLAKGQLQLYQLCSEPTKVVATLASLREGGREIAFTAAADPRLEGAEAYLLREVLLACAKESVAELEVPCALGGALPPGTSPAQPSLALACANLTPRGFWWALRKNLGRRAP